MRYSSSNIDIMPVQKETVHFVSGFKLEAQGYFVNVLSSTEVVLSHSVSCFESYFGFIDVAFRLVEVVSCNR